MGFDDLNIDYGTIVGNNQIGPIIESEHNLMKLLKSRLMTNTDSMMHIEGIEPYRL